MTISISLLVAHFIGDFLLQTDKMAVNKSKSIPWLWLHATVYSLCFIPWGFEFYLVTFATHFFTDFVTSRITSKLWFLDADPELEVLAPIEEGWFAARFNKNRHYFFVMIGLDQLIHFWTLAWTLKLLST